MQHYVLDDKIFFFGEAGAGIGLFPRDNTGETNTRIRPTFAFGSGYRFSFNEHKYLQASLSYSRYYYNRDFPFSFSWVALRVAYGFSWGSIKTDW